MSTQTAGRRRAAGRAAGVVAAVVIAALGASVATEAGVTSPYVRRSIIQLAPGITHERGTMRTSSGIQAVQIATIDPTDPDVSLQALLSNDTVVKLEKPTRNANRHSTATWKATVATNGDVSAAGDWGAHAGPHSMLVHRGEVWVGPTCARPTLGVGADGTTDMRMVRIWTQLDMGSLRSSPPWVNVKGINTDRQSSEIILYTPRFGPSTLTKDDGSGSEVVLQTDDAVVRPAGSFTGTVVQMRLDRGNSTLRPGQMVVSASGRLKPELARLHEGAVVTITTHMMDGEVYPCQPKAEELSGFWTNVQETMGGNWWDSHDGTNAAPSRSDYYAGAVPAPRTAIGRTRDGKVILAAVDGRQGGYSVGVSLAEMGQLMLSLGAVDSTNLDGGGSTVMGIRQPGADNLRVSNRPSDGSERSLTMAIVAFARQSPAD
ncbi:MAG: phosphodiester glycosidase family protein [Chloroflexota bacterium]